jgi:predicted dehydrogenase
MTSNRINVGIVGLGRWAKVLARAVGPSDLLRITSGYSRSQEKRTAFHNEFGVPAAPDLATMLADPAITGVVITVPNEQHLTVAREVAKAGKHVYTEKPIASTLEDGLEIEALEKTYGVTVTVGHSARLMAGIRLIRQAIDAGELGRVAFIDQFLQQRARAASEYLALVQGPRAGPGAVAARDPSLRVLHYLGGEIAATRWRQALAGRREVDDQSMTTLWFADGKVGYVGSCWTSPGVFAVRVFGSKASCTTRSTSAPGTHPPAARPRRSTSSAARTATASASSSDPQATCSAPSSTCSPELPHRQAERASARNGNVAVAVVYAALRSIEKNGQAVRIADVLAEAHARVAERMSHVA